MSESKNKTILSNFTYRKALWLAPIAFLIHLIEEIAFKFWEWENKYLGAEMTFSYFIIFNLLLMAIYFVLIILHHFWPNRPTALITLIAFLGVQFHNAIYHLFFSIYYGVYSPGVISGLIVYIPLNCYFILLAYRDNYINKISGLIVFLIAGAGYWLFHFFGEVIILGFFIIITIILIIFYIKSVRSTK